MNGDIPGTCYCWCQDCGESKTRVVTGVIGRDSPQDKHCGDRAAECFK